MFFNVDRSQLTWLFSSLKLGDLELKKEQKAALNTVASNMIANLPNILTTGFIVHFVVGRLIV